MSMWWRKYGVCRAMDPDLFFPPDNTTVRDKAREACSQCPVKKLCLGHALEHEPYGYWGGTTARERMRIRHERFVRAGKLGYTILAPAPCGTQAGYSRHRRLKEKTCDECKLAHNEDKKSRSTAAPSSQGSAIRELRGAAVSPTERGRNA